MAARGRHDRLDDASLVVRAQAGETHCFELLVARHRPAVRSAVRDHVTNTEDQLDVAQQAYTRSFTRLSSLRDPAAFRPWLLQIARRAAIDHRRRAARRPVQSLDGADRPALESTDPSPSELAELSELARRLDRGLARLSVRDAAALMLSARYGCGPSEIGATLGVSNNNAKVILHRARRRLRSAIDGGPGEISMAGAGKVLIGHGAAAAE